MPNFDEITQSTAEIKLLTVSETGRPPYWNSISGFDFDLCICYRHVILHLPAKFRCNRTIGGGVLTICIVEEMQLCTHVKLFPCFPCSRYQSRFFCFKRTSVYKLNKLLSVRGSLLSCSVILLLTNCTSCTMFSVPNK